MEMVSLTLEATLSRAISAAPTGISTARSAYSPTAPAVSRVAVWACSKGDDALCVVRALVVLACAAFAWGLFACEVRRALAAAGFAAAFARVLVALAFVLAVGILKSLFFLPRRVRGAGRWSLSEPGAVFSTRTLVCNPLGEDRYRRILSGREQPVITGIPVGTACNNRNVRSNLALGPLRTMGRPRAAEREHMYASGAPARRVRYAAIRDSHRAGSSSSAALGSASGPVQASASVSRP